MALNLNDVENTSRFNTYSSKVVRKLDQFTIYPHQRGGKSGIAALAPYVLNTTRVLVITPSLQITNQLAAAFGGEPKESFYVKHGVFTADVSAFFVEVARLIGKGREMGDLAENLVIVNAQKLGANSSVDWEQLNRESYNLLIVDEAHHFPAETWNKIVSYFNCKTIFLTATPYRKGQRILTEQNGEICYQISLDELRNRGVIRKTVFREIGTEGDSPEEQKTLINQEILRILEKHDQEDPVVKHQAMVLTKKVSQTTEFTDQLNTTAKREIAASYTGKTENAVHVLQRFEEGKIRVLVVCGKLLEGYDRKEISVCVIMRNVAPESRVLFAQFVGRCVRKSRPDDPVEAIVLSHVAYEQRQNYDNLNEIAEVDPDEEEEVDS